eukprot:FR741624.1.p1 GENE.FR741624.1~~FR741624.1.p1  ORF type:complete len:296 (+),score=-6.29 FR741624.1:108-890(+)
MEHDVAVTGGDWRMVFDGRLAPRKLDLDFVSQKVGFSTKVSRVHGGGAWNLNFRNGMLSRVKAEEVAVHFGPLVRFSVKLIDHIHEMSLEGATGHSEVAPSTLCNMTTWCRMGNLSFVGLLDYKLPAAVPHQVFNALSKMAPNLLFHPIRDVKSVSSSESIKSVGVNQIDRAPGHLLSSSPIPTRRENATAMCLLANPRPMRPSFHCPHGCPHYQQTTCPHVNCMWGTEPYETYAHMAVTDCISKCMRGAPHPWPDDTST